MGRRTQVQLVELLHSRCGSRNDLVADRNRSGGLNLDTARNHQQSRHERRIGQSGTIQPLRSAKLAEPIGRTLPDSREGAPIPGILTLALMELTKKILPVTLLRTLFALEG